MTSAVACLLIVLVWVAVRLDRNATRDEEREWRELRRSARKGSRLP